MHDVLDDVEIALQKLAASEQSIDITRLHRMRNQVEALWTRTVDEFDRNGEWIDGGFATAGAAIRKKCNMEPGQASHDLKLGRKLRTMPAMALAFENGEVSREHVQALADAMTSQRSAAMSEIESQLTHLAREFTPKQFRQIVRRYTDALDGDDGATQDEKDWRRRRFHLSEMLDGMGRGDFLLNREDTKVVSNALSHFLGPPTDGDERTSEQRRADAFVEMCRRAAEGGSDGNWSKPRADISEVIDIAEIERRDPEVAALVRAEARTGHGLSKATLERLTCDCSIARVITDGPSQVLDVGWATRTWPTPIRRAIEARDGGCTHPGCDRPPGWCEIHHIVHWEDGGETSAENGKMVCRYHHVVQHLRDALGHDPP